MATKQTTATNRKAIGFLHMWNIAWDALGRCFLILGRVARSTDAIAEIGEAHAATFNHTEMEKLEKKHPNLRQQLNVDFD